MSSRVDYAKLKNKEEGEILLNENESDFSESGRSSQGSGQKLSSRQKAALASFIAVTLVVVITISVVLTQKDGWLGKHLSRLTRSDRKFTLHEVLSGKYAYNSYNTQWISDVSYLHTDAGTITQYNMDSLDSSDVITSAEASICNIDRVHQISPDKKWFLFSNSSKSLYRHSFYGDYYVKNLTNGVIRKIKTPSSSDNEQIRYCGWSSTGNALVIVYKCNIYYIPTVDANPLQYYQITKDGIPKKIFNGVPDWVYEEEIIASTHAIEFSSNGQYMSYVKFNATAVPFYRFPKYGSPTNLYTTIEKIAYPKAGYPNPTIKIIIIDLHSVVKGHSTTHLQLNAPTEMTKGEYYYAVMQWDKERLFIQWLNRAQNETMCLLYEANNASGIMVEEHKTPNGWIDDDYVKPYFVKNGSYYITMLPKSVPGKGDFRHLAKVTITPTGGVTEFLTEGTFTVQDLNCFDEDNEVIYFRSTEVSPRYRHVYSVDVQTKEKRCVSCGKIKDSDGTDCTYYYPQFSRKCSWVTLMCQGPFVPITNMHGLKSGRKLVLTNNNSTKSLLAEKDLPTNVYYTIKSDGYDIPVRETRPFNFDSSKKYAVLFDVYGGPNTQKVIDKFPQYSFDTFFVSSHDIILITLDARGTGYYGYKFLHAVYRNLGYYESVDAINVAKYLKTRSYVDPDRIAIWGWSYGGFYSATVLAMSDVIKTAVSVAPVTDWRYYDTVYSERYMGFPSKEDNLAGYEKTSVMSKAKDFAGKNFLLIHGTADDNVHFQNSAQLVSALVKEKIKFRSQFFPDKDHSIQSGGHIYFLVADFLLEHLSATRLHSGFYRYLSKNEQFIADITAKFASF